MTELDVALVRLLLAAAGSLAAGGTVWAAAVLCTKCLPALAQQRSSWLLAQVAVAAVFVAMLLPTTERLAVVPVIEMGDSRAPQVSAAFAPPMQITVPAGATASPVPDWNAWLRDAGRAWLVMYLLGLGYNVYGWHRTRRLLDALAASGQRLTGLYGHAGFSEHAHTALPPVIEVEAPISPMLHGLLRPRLLLPLHLRSFDPLQQRLIVEHELTHWRRRDLHWSAAARVLQCLFWFNPLMRMLGARLGWAQEFGCDREVLRERPQVQRKAYAAALVAQLKLQQRPAGMAMAFGASGTPTLTARVNLIRSPIAVRGTWARGAALLSLAAVVGANLVLQPALSWNGGGVSEGLARAWPTMASGNLASLDCTIMVDADSGDSVVREGTCDQRTTPASTFKIAISLMGFDSGVLRDEHTPYLPYKQRYAAGNPSWRHGTDPARWLRDSVVWYSDHIRLQLGESAVRGYVNAFGYGNHGRPNDTGIDDKTVLSELSPTLQISAIEQIVFLRKLVNRSLPVSAHAYDMTERLLKVETQANGWTIYGKTGTANRQLPDGSDKAIGWFVGWAKKDGRTLVFARLLEQPVRTDAYAGPLTRDAFLNDLARSRL